MPEEVIAVMPYEEIPFMHWGVITRYNFSKEKARYVPRKRWDPLTSVEIRLYDEVSRVLIPIGKKRGHFSYISPIRGRRPQASKHTGQLPDVFEDILAGKDYAIFVALDDKRAESPFSVQPTMMRINGYSAVTIINRYPAMIRYLEESIRDEVKRLVEDPYTRIAYGVNLITFPTKFSETLSDVTRDSLAAMLKSMIAAISYCVEEARKLGVHLIPVYPFFNIGYMAGASQRRLHAQVYIDLNMDGHGALMENILQAFEDQKRAGSCHLCTSKHEGRVVYENSRWIVWATSSPRRNYHLRLATKRHVARITDLDAREVQDLADALIVVSRALDRLGVSKDRNVLFYSNPYGYGSFFHLFIDFIPFERIGGVELLDSCRVARYAPEEIAEMLRKAVAEEAGG